MKPGGVKFILATATSGKAMPAALGGPGIDGKLIVLGAAEDSINLDPLFLIGGRRAIAGRPTGTSFDSQDALAFAAFADIRAMTEVYPL